MILEHEILLNQYGQGYIKIDSLKTMFENFNLDDKRLFMNDLIQLIQQSKPKEEDIQLAIEKSELKPTYTPCVLMKKGVGRHNLKKIIELPEKELGKSLILLLNLFRIAYYRRYEIEKNTPSKWWYWDLSDQKKVNIILNKI